MFREVFNGCGVWDGKTGSDPKTEEFCDLEGLATGKGDVGDVLRGN
jgi:hypothetical protein